MLALLLAARHLFPFDIVLMIDYTVNIRCLIAPAAVMLTVALLSVLLLVCAEIYKLFSRKPIGGGGPTDTVPTIHAGEALVVTADDGETGKKKKDTCC